MVQSSPSSPSDKPVDLSSLIDGAMELLHGEAPTVVDPRQMAGEVATDQVAEEPKAAEVPKAAFVVHIFCDLYCASTEEHTKYCRGRRDFFDQVTREQAEKKMRRKWVQNNKQS